jgi:glyoxylase-like metal-dependent hydrolase (beta-lactamase superfamily II)
LLSVTAVEPEAAQAQAAGPLRPAASRYFRLRANFFMIAGAGGNIGVQVGEDGVVVVDAGSAAGAADVVAAIKRISPKPIRYVIDTGPDADHVGGNDVLSKAGDQFYPGTRPAGPRQDALRSVAAILAAEGVVRHMTASFGTAMPSGCRQNHFITRESRSS